MNSLTERNVNILRLIVEEYIATGELVGSKSLLKKYNLGVSSATIRSDMAKLENYELIFQPYNSAGRYPTNKGLRIFINYMMDKKPDYFLAPKNINIGENNYESVFNSIHRITYDLSKNTGEISFVILEEGGILEYSGISSFIEKNMKSLGGNFLNIVKVLEERVAFINLMSSINTSENVTVILGDESKIAYLKDYSIIVRPVLISGKRGYIGLIGSLRMDYSFNISALRGII